MWPGYEDLVTDEMKTRIRLTRLARPPAATASDYECMVYLHTATLACMPNEMWSRIYEFLFSQAYPEQAKKIGVYKDELRDGEKRELTRLRSWIYQQQMKTIKKGIRPDKDKMDCAFDESTTPDVSSRSREKYC